LIDVMNTAVEEVTGHPEEVKLVSNEAMIDPFG
jgi:hypothetical protein